MSDRPQLQKACKIFSKMCVSRGHACPSRLRQVYMHEFRGGHGHMQRIIPGAQLIRYQNMSMVSL
jgi:hypothetical protein